MQKKLVIGITAALVVAAIGTVAAINISDYSRKENLYQEAAALSQQGQYREAADVFGQLKNYKDAQTQQANNLNHIAYNEAVSLYDQIQTPKTPGEYLTAAEQYRQAADAFGKASGYLDASTRGEECRAKSSAYTTMEEITSTLQKGFFKTTGSECMIQSGVELYRSEKDNLRQAGIDATLDDLLRDYIQGGETMYQRYKDDLRRFAGTYVCDKPKDSNYQNKIVFEVNEDEWTITFSLFGKDRTVDYPFNTSIYYHDATSKYTYFTSEKNKEGFTMEGSRQSLTINASGNTHAADGRLGYALYFDVIEGTFTKQ